MNKIQLLYNAIQAGQNLKNPEIWKKRQALWTAFVTILSVIPAFTDLPLSQEHIDTISTFLAGAIGIWNIYLTFATTDKIGI
jgi:hypothetical protein